MVLKWVRSSIWKGMQKYLKAELLCLILIYQIFPYKLNLIRLNQKFGGYKFCFELEIQFLLFNYVKLLKTNF